MNTTVIDNGICVGIEAPTWSGRRKLRKTDLKTGASDLPPEDLASLGSKKVYDTSKLKVFERLKRRAHRECEAVGTRFMGGYFVPVSRMKDLSRKLDAIKAESYEAKETFLGEYAEEVEEWINAHAEWADMIRSAITPKSVVASRINFRWVAFRVSPAGAEVCESQDSDFNSEVKGLADTLFDEIAKTAADAWEKSYQGKGQVSMKALYPLRNIASKLDGLSFLDPRVIPLVRSIQGTLARMPARGPIDGMELEALHGLLFLLSNVERMKAHGEACLTGASDADDDEVQTVEVAQPTEAVADAAEQQPQHVVEIDEALVVIPPPAAAKPTALDSLMDWRKLPERPAIVI